MASPELVEKIVMHLNDQVEEACDGDLMIEDWGVSPYLDGDRRVEIHGEVSITALATAIEDMFDD